ncbi:hypothetical protein DY245_08395 [Streptomyces inhibens]|uniref:Uncharacterized protein n=1 Tax=Streptomyces inhibens TaxID=2293571 RepID=A0A371Q7S6_STRIH|nr:hypothetical protein [Streptomyces inhibens]REK90752.1 hypothetical protein DY245_08395 [Streptomyces inhibens]
MNTLQAVERNEWVGHYGIAEQLPELVDLVLDSGCAVGCELRLMGNVRLLPLAILALASAPLGLAADPAPVPTPRRSSWVRVNEPEGRAWPAPPRAEDRLPFTVAAPDPNRLELQSVLITAGVPLVPGGRETVRRIAELRTPVVDAVVGRLGGRR